MTWGSWGKQLSKKDMADLMHHCLEHHITTFDHADIYGAYTTEADFGKAFLDSGIKREDIQLISKCGIQYLANNRDNKVKHYNYSQDYIIWSAEESLCKLQTDHLDTFLLHRPSPLMRADEIAEAVVKLKNQGKILYFGLSNFTPSQSDLIRKYTDVTCNQIEISLSNPDAMSDGSLDHMILNDIAAMAWSPLGSVFKEESEANKRILDALYPMTENYGLTKDALLLNWLLRHPARISPVIAA